MIPAVCRYFQSKILKGVFIGLFGLIATAAPVVASADGGLQFIHNPGGGEIVYGAISGQTTLPGAMGFILKQVHGHFGDRPQLGKFFHTQGSDSIASFFTLADKTHGGGKIAGLVIVAMQGSQPSAAVVYDDAQRFSTTANPMMKQLNEVWHTGSAKSGSDAGKAGAGGPVAPLRQTVFPDNSGSIGLPAGWQITFAQQGAMSAAGPNGETFLVGMYVPVMDPNNPQQRQMIQMETQGGRVPLPGSYVAVPYGMEPFRLLQALSAQMHAKQRKPTASLELLSNQELGNNCHYMTTHLDEHDGKGQQWAGITMCILQPFMPGTYAVTINQVILPERLLEQEKATLRAMYSSYKTNDAVINAESRAAIDQIHAIGERAKIQADASDASWKIHQEGYKNQQDSQDRSNQAFSNYLRDETVVQDTQRNERGTVSNGYADSLVKADPNRYQYVPTQDFLKGIDY